MHVLRPSLPDRLAHWVRPWVTEVALAAALAGAAAAARVAMMPLIGSGAPFVLLFVAIVGATLLGGWRSGIATTLIGQALIWYLIVEPAYSFKLLSVSDTASMVLATLCQLAIVGVVAFYQPEIDGPESLIDEHDRALRKTSAWVQDLADQSLLRLRNPAFTTLLAPRHSDPILLRYLSGLGVWAISFTLRALLQPLTPYSPHIVFIPSLMVVAWFWGRGPALLFLATTTIVASIYFVPHPAGFQLTSPTELATSLQFVLVGGAVILIVDRLVAARRALDRQLKSTQQLSAQRETLLEEINHRVKNHLQAIIALTPAGQDDRIDQIRVRMLVLARAYDKLKLRAEGPKLDAATFLAELTTDFQDSLAPNGGVRLSCSVTCGALGSKEAVFLGLIANEAVSNSLKYAFPRGHGEIAISLQEYQGKRTLVIRDDGAGDTGTVKGTGQGRRLMNRLAKDLGGEVRLEGPPGYSVSVSYPLPADPSRSKTGKL